MDKVLLIFSGLENSKQYVNPFLKYLEVYLEKKNVCVDTRDLNTFDERTFFEYNQVIFVFMTTLDSVPSSMLEIFKKLESQDKSHAEVYALIACDEYESEKCDLSEKIIKNWCCRENVKYKGSLKIGSTLFIMRTVCKFIVANEIKKFVSSICKHENVSLNVTLLNESMFMKKANKYWDKEIRKEYKNKINHK